MGETMTHRLVATLLAALTAAAAPEPPDRPKFHRDIHSGEITPEWALSGVSCADLGAPWMDPTSTDLPPDLDGDCIVGFGDLIILMSGWGPCPDWDTPDPPCCRTDLNRDGITGHEDLVYLLSAFELDRDRRG